jgi:hypothetical protein
MSSNRRLDVAGAWIQLQRNWWAYHEVQDAVADRPRKAWLLLGRIADLASTRELESDLGAGPLEDFVRLHAPRYIGQIERRASEHDRFCRAMGWVRLPRARDRVSQRLFALKCRPIEGGLARWQLA